MMGSGAIRARHAVRNYTTKPLSPTVIDELKEEVDRYNRLGQLHIQLVMENGGAFKDMVPLLGGFEKAEDYIALAAKKRNGFYTECGYYGARLMIRAQRTGLNSCWVTNTYNAKKCLVSLEPRKEPVGVIAIGYGTTDGTQHKSKSTEKLCKPCDDRRLIDGMSTTVLTLTDPNKQNFFTEASGDIMSIRPENNRPMSQTDIGIVKYHSEVGAGGEDFIWR